MNTIVARWGNSLGLRIPRGYAEALHLEERSTVHVAVENGALVVRPVVDRKKFDLDTLIAGITDENLHGEIDTGQSVGNEF
jgi:antitoxin MazE